MGLDVRFKGPVKVGDTIRAVVKVADKKETKKGDKGIVHFDLTVKNQEDEVVYVIKWVIMILKKA
jgi:acyl dehydratase